eukprot:608785-Pyramimonas_sp.AAC.1
MVRLSGSYWRGLRAIGLLCGLVMHIVIAEGYGDEITVGTFAGFDCSPSYHSYDHGSSNTDR